MSSIFKHAFLSYGFRPFFLFGSGYAALVMGVWLLWLGGLMPPVVPALGTGTYVPSLWHAHEIVFGFAAAGLMGFLLTAVPNWTGTQAIKGAPLFILVLLWLAGRIAMWASGALDPALAAWIDLAALPVALVIVVRAVVAGKNWRNLLPVFFIGVLIEGHVMFHWPEISGASQLPSSDSAAAGLALSFNALLVLITIIGGRITPAFTAGALGLQAQIMRPTAIGRVVDIAAILSMVTLMVADHMVPGTTSVGVAAAIAAVVNAARLSRWYGHRTRHDATLWVMHLAYGFLIVGLALKAAALLGAPISDRAGAHALGSGAIGLMVMAVMTRAGLGHTGRAIVATPAITSAITLVAFGAVIRTFGPEAMPAYAMYWYSLSGTIWALGFLIFFVTFLPILTGPRADVT